MTGDDRESDIDQHRLCSCDLTTIDGDAPSFKFAFEDPRDSCRAGRAKRQQQVETASLQRREVCV